MVPGLWKQWLASGGSDDFNYFISYFSIDDWEKVRFRGQSEREPFLGILEGTESEQRFRNTDDYYGFGPRYAALSYYRKRLMKSEDTKPFRLWEHFISPNLKKIKNEGDLRSWLSRVSAYTTKNTFSSVFGKYFLYFKNLLHLGPNVSEKLFSSVPSLQKDKKNRTVYQQAREWTVGKINIGGDDYKGFLEEFRSSVKHWFSFVDADAANEYEYFDIDGFLKSGLWATSGSTSLRVVDKLLDKNKNSNLADSLQNLRSVMTSTSVETIRVSPKEESKLRTIVSGDMSMYLKESFIYEWISRAIKKHPHATMLWSSANMSNFYTELGLKLSNPSAVAIPIDIDAFDFNFTVDMEDILYEELQNCMNLSVSESDYKSSLSEVFALLSAQRSKGVNIKVKVGERDEVWKREKGFLSGRKLTALFGSISSFAYAHICSKGESSVHVYTQGDDACILAPSIVSAVNILAKYDKWKIPTNPRKFGLGIGPDKGLDYLQRTMFYYKNDLSIRGPPARSVHKLFWRDPWKQESKTMRSEFTRICTVHSTVARRLMQNIDFNDMVSDLVGFSRLEKSKIEEILHTPLSSGGMGFTPLLMNKEISWENEVIASSRPSIIYPPNGILANLKDMQGFGRWWRARVVPKKPDKILETVHIKDRPIFRTTALPPADKSFDLKRSWFLNLNNVIERQVLEFDPSSALEEIWTEKFVLPYEYVERWTKAVRTDFVKGGPPTCSFNFPTFSDLGLTRFRARMSSVLQSQVLRRVSLSMGDVLKLKLNIEAAIARGNVAPDGIRWYD